MKQTYLYLMDGKSVFFPSIIAGGISCATVRTFFELHTPEEIFGYSLSMWFVALLVNFWDIYTGVRADIVTRKKNGGKFEFSEDKGWKAFEKIFGFSIIICLIWRFELEAIRLNYDPIVTTSLNVLKSIFFFYVMLIELKSIGRNNETRFGYKGDLFKLLDRVISIVDGGLMYRLKNLIYGEKDINENENNNEKL